MHVVKITASFRTVGCSMLMRSTCSKSSPYESTEPLVYETPEGRPFHFKHGIPPAMGRLHKRSRGIDLKGWRIRVVNIGCPNRPFFQLVVQRQVLDSDDPYTEQIGSYDPLPNKFGERLMAVSVQRLKWWLGEGAQPTKSVRVLLGLVGILPIHPKSYLAAMREQTRCLKDVQSEEN